MACASRKTGARRSSSTSGNKPRSPKGEPRTGAPRICGAPFFARPQPLIRRPGIDPTGPRTRPSAQRRGAPPGGRQDGADVAQRALASLRSVWRSPEARGGGLDAASRGRGRGRHGGQKKGAPEGAPWPVGRPWTAYSLSSRAACTAQLWIPELLTKVVWLAKATKFVGSTEVAALNRPTAETQ